MSHLIAAGLLLLAPSAAADEAETFLARVEREVLLVRGKVASRIEKDAEGNVIRLRLDGMQLTSDDFVSLGRLKTLQRLDLRETNTTDEDLRHLLPLKNLNVLVLTSTEVTDDATLTLEQFEGLRTLCMGDVDISPAAIAAMRENFELFGRRLSLGYSQRKAE